MLKQRRGFREFARILLLLFYPLAAVSFFYFSAINQVTAEGTLGGFRIGASKLAVYLHARRLFESGSISGINARPFAAQDVEQKCSVIRDQISLAEARNRFSRWHFWRLEGLNVSTLKMIGLQFHGEALQGIRTVDFDNITRMITSWSPDQSALDFKLNVGETRKETLTKLVALQKKGVLSDLMLSAGWKASTLTPQFPNTPDDPEYEFLKYFDRWVLYVDDSYLNSVILTFKKGQLLQIKRSRKYYQGPWECFNWARVLREL